MELHRGTRKINNSTELINLKATSEDKSIVNVSLTNDTITATGIKDGNTNINISADNATENKVIPTSVTGI